MALPNQEYLKTKVLTASPELLTLMLWDGAIRFAEQGKEAIGRKEIEASYKALVRSQRIVMELSGNLRHEVNPELCGKLAALYNFIYRRLVDANISKDAKLVDDALEIMRHQRQTWVLLMDKLSKEKAVEAQATVTANVDALTSAEAASAAMESVVRPNAPPRVPSTVTAGVGPQSGNSPTRRGYPNFAVRPLPSHGGVQSISIEG